MSEYTDITHRNFWSSLKPLLSTYEIGMKVTHLKSGKSGIIKYIKGNAVGVNLEGNKHIASYHFKFLKHD